MSREGKPGVRFPLVRTTNKKDRSNSDVVRATNMAAIRLDDPETVRSAVRVGAASEEQWIRLSKLVIPREGEMGYQRQFSESWARKIARGFDERLWTKPKVAIRLGGKQFAVIDGQHRVEALRILYPDIDPEVLCDVQSFPSVEAEAQQFLAVNHYVRPTGSKESFKARLIAGDSFARNIDRLVTAYGYTLKTDGGRQRDGQLLVAPVQLLLRQHGIDDWPLLEETLRVVREAYGDRTANLGSLFGGIGSFIAMYRNDAGYDRRRLIATLRRTAPNELTRDARDLRRLLRSSDMTASRRSIVMLYNNRLAQHNRLPEL